jgi:DNA repair exonuclease SbcCD ATPase subunit
MRRYPEAYENNSEISALLKGASEIYPEIDSFRVEWKARQAQNIQPEKAKSMTERILENNQQIKKLERELERVKQQENLIHSEEQNLAQLEQDLEALREQGPHASEPEYDEDGDLINEECDEEELLEGIEDNQRRLSAAREELAGMGGHRREELEQKIEFLYDENDVLTSDRSYMINTKVDGFVQRCDEKIRGIPQAEVQAKAALKTFILNPNQENLKAFQDVTKANPIIDEAANKRLDALVHDALTLVKDDPKGYKEVMAERASQAKASPNPSSLVSSKQLDQLPGKNDVKTQEPAPKSPGVMSRFLGGS